ncbi:MAG: hypothetical protein AB7D57_10430 [Desulfovibrionaceae bacterium]
MEKPVVNGAKYSVLFMRDDTDVRRLRMSPFWLRAFLTAQALLLVLGVGGAWLGIAMWSQNHGLKAEKRDLTTRIEEADLRLATLANMEKILEAYDKKDLQSLLDQAPKPNEPGAPAPAAAPAPAPACPDPVNLRAVLAEVHHGVVGVLDLKAEFENNRCTLSFRVENPNEGVLSGRVLVALVTNDGRAVTIRPREDLDFQIQKRKYERTTFALPTGLAQNDIYGIRLTIESSDATVFQQTYPL